MLPRLLTTGRGWQRLPSPKASRLPSFATVTRRSAATIPTATAVSATAASTTIPPIIATLIRVVVEGNSIFYQLLRLCLILD